MPDERRKRQDSREAEMIPHDCPDCRKSPIGLCDKHEAEHYRYIIKRRRKRLRKEKNVNICGSTQLQRPE